jgi:hypothetical protein
MLDEARSINNTFVATGEPPAIEIARALTDISRTLYALASSARSSVEDDELLFFDRWIDPNAMEQFFTNPAVAEAGARLFSRREESEWAQVPSAFNFHVPAPHGTSARYIGMTRNRVRSVQEASALLGDLVQRNLLASRRRGQESHDLFVRYANLEQTRPAANGRFNGIGRVPSRQLQSRYSQSIRGRRSQDSMSITATRPRWQASRTRWQAHELNRSGKQRAVSQSGRNMDKGVSLYGPLVQMSRPFC